MDLFDLKVVGWAYGKKMTDDLVIEAFKKAMKNRGLNKDGIFHSDRGSQYTSNDFEELFLKFLHDYISLLLYFLIPKISFFYQLFFDLR